MTLVTENVHLSLVALHGLIEELVRRRPQQDEEKVPAGLGVASNHDALEAVIQLATAIWVPAEAGDLAPDKAYRMASLLLVIRDYIEPVAAASDDDEAEERLTRYLTEVVDGLRRYPQSGR
jgi:hypothetical protein